MKLLETPKATEQIEYYRSGTETAEQTAAIALQLGKIAMDFSFIERVPQFANGERENDAEHSYMLALVAPELAAALEIPLDIGLVSQFAIVHDLIELKTGDVATFILSKEQLQRKEYVEHAALGALVRELPPHTAHMLVRYETQTEPEAKFVRSVDKLLPLVVNIVGEGVRVMKEDYSIDTPALLQKSHQKLNTRIIEMFGEEFPEIGLAHQLLCELFESQFALAEPELPTISSSGQQIL